MGCIIFNQDKGEFEYHINKSLFNNNKGYIMG